MRKAILTIYYDEKTREITYENELMSLNMITSQMVLYILDILHHAMLHRVYDIEQAEKKNTLKSKYKN